MIYICIPAHDEERTIGVLLWKIRKVMGEFGRDYQILVVDDASSDGTRDVLARYRRSLPLRIHTSDERLGYAAALERLVREAVARAPYPKRDVVVTLQGDFTENPEDVVSLVKAIEGGADVVAGVSDGEAAGPQPRGLRFARWVAPYLLGRTYRDAPVTDPLSGFRAYRVIVLKRALRDAGQEPLLASDGWAANVELLRAVAPHARRIDESPLALRYDLRTRASRFRPVQTMKGLLRVRGRTWFEDERGVA